MSMIIELFGEEILNVGKDAVIQKIKNLPPALAERRSYLLRDFALCTGIVLTEQDYKNLNA